MIFNRFAVASALATMAICPASAQIAFSNLGSNYSYSLGASYFVSGPTSYVGAYSTAFEFTPTISGTLDHIIVPLGNITGDNSEYTFTLLANNSGTPGTPLYSSTFPNLPLEPLGAPDLITLPFYNKVSITAGTTYWMAASTDNDNFAGWNLTLTPGIVSQNKGSGFPAGSPRNGAGLEVDVIQSVPEPEPFLFLGLGILALRRRKV